MARAVLSPIEREDPDARLVDASRAGDLRAFEELVTRHQDVVYRVAARLVGEEDAHDVAQDTFLRAFHRLPRFRAEGSFRSWLLQIAHNRAMALLEDEQASAGRRAEIGAAAAVPEGERTPVQTLEDRERRRRLDTKLKALSPNHRTVLVLRDVEGLSYEEIARVTAMPLGSVKARLHRARGELIEALRANTYDWELPR